MESSDGVTPRKVDSPGPSARLATAHEATGICLAVISGVVLGMLLDGQGNNALKYLFAGLFGAAVIVGLVGNNIRRRLRTDR